MPRAKLTQPFVKRAKAEPGAERTVWWDESLRGFGLMVTSSGHRSWVCQYRARGVSRRYTIDGRLALAKARKKARAIQGQVAEKHDPVLEERRAKAASENTLQAVFAEYMRRDGRKLRSHAERERIFNTYIFPFRGFRTRQIGDVRKADITRLLDHVEDENGPVQADAVLAALRRLLAWHAARGDDFRPPVLKGMKRAAPAKERARTRTLKDHELRAFWRAAEGFAGAFGYLVRFLLLSTARLREASNMRRVEVSGDVWTVPASRHKSKLEFELPLSRAAQELLAGVPCIEGGPGLVFTHDGRRAIGGFSKFKRAFDAKILAELRKDDRKAKLDAWVLHDLRRTGRSLMSRAGVPSRDAEMTLGHSIRGVEATYDRHDYLHQKRQAVEALASLIARILEPPDANVVRLRRG